MLNSTQFQCAKKIKVIGATSADGTPYVRINACEQKEYVPFADFSGSGALAGDKLVAAKIILLNADWARCRALVEDITKFPPKPIIVSPGWAGADFALPDGTVFSPPGSRSPIVLFRPNP